MQYVDSAKTAETLSITEAHLGRLAKAGVIPYIVIGTGPRARRRFDLEAVAKALTGRPGDQR